MIGSRRFGGHGAGVMNDIERIAGIVFQNQRHLEPLRQIHVQRADAIDRLIPLPIRNFRMAALW